MTRMTRKLFPVAAMLAAVGNITAWAADSSPPVQPPPAWAPTPVPAGQPPVVLPQSAPTAASQNGPRIEFDSAIWDFGKAMSGEQVKHIYFFTNTGNEDLVVSNVAPQCGCTTAGQWTRQVKPGEAGEIPIQFNTANYNSPVTKVITVTSNSKTQQLMPLQLRGTVWKPIDVNPQVLVLNLKPDAPFASVTAQITNGLPTPLYLDPPQSANPLFGAELVTNIPGYSYHLVVSNRTLIPAGAIQGNISMKTSVTNLPLLTVLAYASMQAAVTVSPPQLMLPQSPIPTNQLTRYVTLINNGTNPMTLSDTKINVTNVTLSVQALQPGKYYTVTLVFPPDFEIEPGQHVAFSTRTSNPQYELISVPVYQTPRPRVAAASPPAVPVLRRPPPPGTRPIAPLNNPPQAPGGEKPVPSTPIPVVPPGSTTPTASTGSAGPPLPPSQ